MKKLFKIIGIGFIVLFLVWFLYPIRYAPIFNKPSTEDEAWVKSAGQRYYASQKAYYDVQSKAAGVTPDEMNINNTLVKAEKTMKLCLHDIGEKHCEGVIAGDTYIGEPKLWVEMTIGAYTSSKNTTTVKGVVHEQWVFGDPLYGATYMYFDNDILTAVQNTSN